MKLLLYFLITVDFWLNKNKGKLEILLFQIIWMSGGHKRWRYQFWDLVLSEYMRKTSFFEDFWGQLQEKIGDWTILCFLSISDFVYVICFLETVGFWNRHVFGTFHVCHCKPFILYKILIVKFWDYNKILVEVLLYWVRSLEIKSFGGVFFLVCTW